LLLYFGWFFCLCIWKMICRTSEGAPITFLITQNEEELRKICQSVLIIGTSSMMGQSTLYVNLHLGSLVPMLFETK
jgi:hypothetical protein